MFKATMKAMRDVLVGYAIFMSAVGLIHLALDLRDHFRKVPQQY